MTVQAADYLGSVEQNFTVFGISFTVYDDNRKALCYIEGPNVYSCCMSTETQFQVCTYVSIFYFIVQINNSVIVIYAYF